MQNKFTLYCEMEKGIYSITQIFLKKHYEKYHVGLEQCYDEPCSILEDVKPNNFGIEISLKTECCHNDDYTLHITIFDIPVLGVIILTSDKI